MNNVLFFLYKPLESLSGNKIKKIKLPYKLYQSPYGDPAITEEPGTVIGELYSIPESEISKLDEANKYYGKGNANNLYIKKMIKLKDYSIFAYFASPELSELCKKYNIVIADGDWPKFYETKWKFFEENKPTNIDHTFSEEDLQEVCNDLGAETIEEVNALLESAFRRNIMLEATNRKNPNDDEENLDDLNEPDAEIPPEFNVTNDEEKPSLDDLNEPEQPIEEPTEQPITAPLNAPKVPSAPIEEPVPAKQPKPIAPTLPSSKNLPASEKKEEPQVNYDWKKEKHLRTLYNNFFKVFPSRGTSTKVAVTFNSIKANSLHPDLKYLQASITSMCTSEDPTKHDYYSQWIQLRRQRLTQEWSVDLPCEVRCDCKSFIYYLAFANMRNKSLAGAVTRRGTKDGYPINYTLPSDQTNPNYIPALCKHLVGLTNEIFNIKGDGKVKQNNIV